MGFDAPLTSGETVNRLQQEGVRAGVVGGDGCLKFLPSKGLDLSIGFYCLDDRQHVRPTHLAFRTGDRVTKVHLSWSVFPL